MSTKTTIDDYTDEQQTNSDTDTPGAGAGWPGTIGAYWMKTAESDARVFYWSNGIEIEYRIDEHTAVATDGDGRRFELPKSSPVGVREWLDDHAPSYVLDSIDAAEREGGM